MAKVHMAANGNKAVCGRTISEPGYLAHHGDIESLKLVDCQRCKPAVQNLTCESMGTEEEEENAVVCELSIQINGHIIEKKSGEPKMRQVSRVEYVQFQKDVIVENPELDKPYDGANGYQIIHTLRRSVIQWMKDGGLIAQAIYSEGLKPQYELKD